MSLTLDVIHFRSQWSCKYAICGNYIKNYYKHLYICAYHQFKLTHCSVITTCHSMEGWLEVITGVRFNRMAAMQGFHLPYWTLQGVATIQTISIGEGSHWSISRKMSMVKAIIMVPIYNCPHYIPYLFQALNSTRFLKMLSLFLSVSFCLSLSLSDWALCVYSFHENPVVKPYWFLTMMFKTALYDHVLHAALPFICGLPEYQETDDLPVISI